MIVKKEYQPLPTTDIIRFSAKFTREFLTDDEDRVVDIPIDALRILFKIASDLRYSQFQDSQPHQLELFHQDFLTEHNTFATFEINLNEVLINKNTNRGRNALEFLANFKKGWYTTKNKDGETIKSYGGLITSPSYKRGSATFLVSSYWLSQLSYLPQYNKVLYDLAFKISSNKHIIFYLWLLTLENDGCIINYTTLNERYHLNYSNAKELSKGFLKSIKINLDKYSNISFNYSYKGDKINIARYHLSENIEVRKVSTKTYLVIARKAHYWKSRHELSEAQKKGITSVLKNDKSSINLLNEAYKSFVKQTRVEGKRTTDYTGQEFMRSFQEAIKNEYQKSKAAERFPNGHPRIL